MSIPTDPLEDVPPELYLAVLSELAHADGLHPSEQEMLETQARQLGVDLRRLPAVPDDLTQLPWAARVLVYKDALTLAAADGVMSDAEIAYLAALAERMQLPEETIAALTTWVADFGQLLERFDALMIPPP